MMLLSDSPYCDQILDSIANPEGYLYVTLRNLRLSQVRRASRRSQLSSIANYDSMVFGLRASNLRAEIQVQDGARENGGRADRTTFDLRIGLHS
jgi:DNA-directed RNA polymerase specialized sigma24 family protein